MFGWKRPIAVGKFLIHLKILSATFSTGITFQLNCLANALIMFMVTVDIRDVYIIRA